MTNLYLAVRDFGAVGDGVTDDSAPILAAVNQANAAGGGVVFFSAGTYLTGTIPLYSNVHFCGAAEEAAILLLKAGTNNDLFSGTLQGYTNGVNGYSGPSALVNIAAPTGTGNNSGVNSITVRNLTLDGNAANQSAYSAGIRLYGYGNRILNLYIRNFRGDGIYIDWNPNVGNFSLPPNQLENVLQNLKIHDIGYNLTRSVSMGIRWAGGTDSMWNNITVYKTGSHGVHIGPNGGAAQITQLHVWGMLTGNHAAGILCESPGCQFLNCEAEGSDLTQVACITGMQWTGGKIFAGGPAGASSYGIQLGQFAADTPYVGSTYQTTPGNLANPPVSAAGTAYVCTESLINTAIADTALGAFYIRAEHYNRITALVAQNGSNPMIVSSGVSPVFDSTDTIDINSSAVPLNHLAGGTGYAQISAPLNASGFTVGDGRVQLLTVNTSAGTLAEQQITLTGSRLQVYQDWFGGTETARLDHYGALYLYKSGIALGSNTAAQVLNNNSTVTVYQPYVAGPSVPQTGGYTAQGFHFGKIRVSALLAVTGLILQAGLVDGTETTVVNESAVTLRFAKSGSNISVSSYLIPADAARKFLWNAPTKRWYPQS